MSAVVRTPEPPAAVTGRPRSAGRGSRWWVVRVLVLATGLVGLSAGGGLGPRHYAEEGLTPVAGAGWLLLLAGLIASAWATISILRATRRRWWPLIIALLLVASYLLLWTLGQAVAASYTPRPALGGRTPADLGMTYQDVTFSSSDGVELAGWYVPARNGAAVALMHGAGSTRTAVLEHAAVLVEHGYGVLLFDARGHGESAGRGMDFGWYGESDASGAVDFLTRQPDVSPESIALLGVSMGGEEAIGAAGADDRVDAVVAEGATNRVASDKGYLEAYGARGDLQQRVDHVTYWLTDLLTDAPEPDSLQRSLAIATGRRDPTSFLLITAGNVPDEAHAARYVQRASPEDVQTWTVPYAGHTKALEAAPTEWEERVITFLDESLAGTGQ